MVDIRQVRYHKNVNGVNLCLKIRNRTSAPNSKVFKISFKNKERKGHWHRLSLILAIIFNILAFVYIRISVTNLLVIIIVFSFLAFFWITHSVQSESIIVIPTVGIQSSIKFVFGREDVFVPWSNIDDIVINEVIKLNCVLYYLTLLVKTSPNQSNQDSYGIKLMPLFKYTKPRLVMLEIIYSEFQTLLMGAQRDGVRSGSGDVE
ncbi:PREDICTED: phosphatidylinositol N-acetylglucosaminyltransferase subunit H-like [Papilio polytes]|uniref:phosphatidylinositol N-acetylglucosaminyltransferase subunit H-like n=1 Tax=Papilio polytes TaxID=76194 RepID=UPI0006769CCE|nr:PREDICTED: phosphatidylinositol N-acetylglucosaminyltransferase subunit H-like [Papilio polytes]